MIFEYPYTDMHELNLDWFLAKFKELVETWNNVESEWNDLHDYVQNYFENLNVQTEINNKINAMILDGTFADIVSPFVTAALPALVAGQLPDVVAAQISAVVAAQISAVVADQLPAVAAAAAAAEVGDWLTAHIDPDTGYVIDDTLTVSQAAADAKTVGDRVNKLKSALNPDHEVDFLDYDSTVTSHAGNADKWYQFNNIEANTIISKFKIKAYADCTVRIGIIKVQNSTIVEVFDVSLHAGENLININRIYQYDVTLLFEASVDKIMYSSGNKTNYGLCSLAYASMVVDGLVTLATISSTANFGIGIYIIKLNTVNDLVEVEKENNIVRNLQAKRTIYNGKDGTNNSAAGVAYAYYLTNLIVPKNCMAKLTIGVQESCVYKIALADVFTGEVKFVDSFSFSSGYNTIGINYIPMSDCYIILCAENKTTYHGTDSNYLLSYRSINTGDYLTTSDTVNISPFINSASFDVKTVVYYNDTSDDIMGKIIFLAGDSRSSTDYTFYGAQIEAKTRGTAIVGGASGKKAAYIASNAYFQRLIDNPHDFSIWLVGGNDSGQANSVGTFSATSPNGIAGEPVVTQTDINIDYDGTKFIQAIDHMIRKYRSLFYDWVTLNNGHKPRMIMCTDIPQKRQSSLEYSNPVNWERKRQAIIEACEKNGIPYLDLLVLCSFDMSYEPAYVPPTDKTTNNGLYYMDGLHPNQYGMDLITSIEVAEIRRFLQTL